MIFNPLNYPPHNDYQLSQTPPTDLEGCLSYMIVHAVEPLCKLYGDNTQYNPQYLAETSHTTRQGNTEPDVVSAWYGAGLPSTDDFPELTSFTWDDVYGRDVSGVIKKAMKFWDKYDIQKSGLTPIDLSQAVQISQQATFANPYTVAVIVDLNNGLGSPLYHGQALLNGLIWDSYPTNPKQSNHLIKWAYKVTLVPKRMSNVLLVKKGNEYGYYLPATNEQAMIDKANNFGYALPVINNGSAVDWPNVRPDITV